LTASAALPVSLFQYSTDGGATFSTLCTGASGAGCVQAPGTLVISNGLTLQGGAFSTNSPGTPTLGDISSSTVQMKNPTAATESVLLLAGDGNFMAPTGSVLLNGGIGGSVTIGAAANAITYMSCVDAANGRTTARAHTTQRLCRPASQPLAAIIRPTPLWLSHSRRHSR
jgi:hypothetical protein